MAYKFMKQAGCRTISVHPLQVIPRELLTPSLKRAPARGFTGRHATCGQVSLSKTSLIVASSLRTVESKIDSKWSASQFKNTFCFMSPSPERAFTRNCFKCPSPLLLPGFSVSDKIIIQPEGLILRPFLSPSYCPNASGGQVITIFSRQDVFGAV